MDPVETEFKELRRLASSQHAQLIAALARIAQLEKEVEKRPVATRTRSKTAKSYGL